MESSVTSPVVLPPRPEPLAEAHVAEVVQRRRAEHVDVAPERGAQGLLGAGEVALGQAARPAVVEFARVQPAEVVGGRFGGQEGSREEQGQQGLHGAVRRRVERRDSATSRRRASERNHSSRGTPRRAEPVASVPAWMARRSASMPSPAWPSRT